MLRSVMLRLAGSERVTDLVSHNDISKNLALRFVAGDTFDDAVAAVRELNAQEMMATLDALGENVSGEAEAEAARDQYLSMLDGIVSAGIKSTISLKLTMLGLDIAEDVCRSNLRPVLERARELGTFVRIDMEGSNYTQRTLDMFYEHQAEFGDHVGIVLQSYLYRTDRDVKSAIEKQARVRLVKGAYAEPATVAYPRKSSVDAAYRRQMEALLDQGRHVAIATHDEAIIEAAKGYAMRMNVPNDRFEFQMLYGVRHDLQEKLAAEGYSVRVYVPFGRQWYPYFMRRMAERPANLLFVLRNIARG
jgi:proline dehydrogenase